MSEAILELDFSDQVDQYIERPRSTLRSDIWVRTEITASEKNVTKAGKPCVIATESLLDEDGEPTGTSRKKWVMMPFNTLNLNDLDAAELTEHKKKLNAYQSMGLDFVVGYGVGDVAAPSYDRETKEYTSATGEPISKKEYYEARKVAELEAKSVLADMWRDPDIVVGKQAFRSTKAKTSKDGSTFVEFDKLRATLPEGEKVLYGDDAFDIVG